MLKFLLSRSLLIISVLLSSTLLYCKCCDAAFEDRQAILALDLSKSNNLLILNNYLSGDDILNHFTVRQKFISLSYSELNEISKSIGKMNSMGKLYNLILAILSKMEDENMYFLQEDIYINNTPLLTGSPFYLSVGQDLSIKDLKPYAEHLYFNNLKLKYTKNELIETDNRLWTSSISLRESSIRKGIQNQTKEIANHRPYDKLIKQTRKMWSYEFKDDHLDDFFFDLRQWVKRYEEDLVFPVVYKDTVLVRNEYRLFCLELLSGKEIWSFGDLDKSGNEYYQTFRHPHQNSYGYEFLLSKDTLFTELAGKLVAVSLENIVRPNLLWMRDLGEYTVCTKPILNDNVLVIGLVNARGELWICGFDCQHGALEWSIYIGTSSFLSPVSVISAVENGKIYIGTNHGALLCLSPKDGKIIWLRKYTPKNFSLFDYSNKGLYKDKLLNKGSIPYDTQFIELAGNQLLYYKPRESDYLYILDSKDGKEKEKILIDQDRFYILGVNNGSAIFLEKKSDTVKNAEIKLVELASGKQIYSCTIAGGALKGVIYSGTGKILFKVDDSAHFIWINDNNVDYVKMDTPAKGWLLNFNEGFVFISEDGALTCFDVFDQEYSHNNPSRIEYSKLRQKINDDFVEAAQLNAESIKAQQLRKKILAKIIISAMPLGDFFHTIVNNLEKLREPAWKDFFVELQKLYGAETVGYQNIEIKFTNFVHGAGLIDYCNMAKSDEQFIKDKEGINYNKDFLVKGNNLFIVPIDVVKGERLLSFFLLLNNDQLLCVSESGKVLWGRNIYYGPFWGYNIEQNKYLSMYARNVNAYLYNNILIINDHVNVIAVNVHDGSYMWSTTNKGEAFKEEKHLPPLNQDLFFNRYGVKKSFLKNIMLYTKFLDDKLVIMHGNKIYLIDPSTGFCERYREVNIEGAIQVDVIDGHIYVLPYTLDSIKVLNRELEISGEFLLDFLDSDKEKWPELLFVNDHILLHINPDLYIINKENGKLENKFNLGNLGWYFAEVYKDSLLTITPFQKVISYHVENGSLREKWKFELGSVDQRVTWRNTGANSKYYFVVDEQILLLSRSGVLIFIDSVDLQTGKKLWETPIQGIKGFFYNLSNCINFDRKIKFIVSMGCNEYNNDNADICFNAEGINIESKLLELNITNGELAVAETLPSFSVWAFGKISLIETVNNFIFSAYGRLLKVKNKTNGPAQNKI